MCYDLDSRPPIEPIAGGAHDGQSITLTSEDGTPFQAYLARPVQPSGAGMLILPDVRGLHPFFEELALRFAEHGLEALAIDYFGRTAGVGPRGDEFDYRPHADAVRWGTVQGDIRAGVAHLRSLDGAPGSIFTTGFCMGGRLSSNSATLGLGLAGVVPFYGWPAGTSRDIPAPADVAGRIECPVLALYGGADDGIPAQAREAYDGALDAAGVEHETVVYPGAPHSFFDRKADQFADASADAWQRTLAFIRANTAGASGSAA
jgi:carboxymethylenebutenolidase